MNNNKLRISTMLCLFFSVGWVILMIISTSSASPVKTIDDAVHSVTDTGGLFQLTYINAVLVTITATIFYCGLYSYLKSLNRDWSVIGFVFVPVYCLLNIVVYFSQITVIPRLNSLIVEAENPEMYRAILGLFVQSWSGSVISVMNQLAYAVLAVPSVIFGMLLIKNKKISVPGGWLLLLNGVCCILGAIGTAANHGMLSSGSMAGGILFIFALILFACSGIKKRAGK